MDTPYWEQLQYIGDTRVQSLISLYVAGDDRLMRQAIEHFDWSRIPEGLTTSRYPSALTQIIPPFSLIYVAMVHDYFLHRDDAAFVRARLAGVRGILDWYARHVDNTGVGIACATEKGSYVAACVEVEIDTDKNAVQVLHICQAFECGAIMNPMNLTSQIHGALVQGLGPALREASTFENGKITNASFYTYQVPRFADLPTLHLMVGRGRQVGPVGG